MKTLSLIDIQLVAHEHFKKRGFTTTLDVKNELRKKGFHAIQSEVSLWMDELATDEEWDYESNGTFRMYSLGDDEQYSATLYMVKGNAFWEGELHGKTVWVTHGAIGSTMQSRQVHEHTFPKSRIAWANWKQIITRNYQHGFKAVDNPFIARLRLRSLYQNYRLQNPISCLISYRNTKKYMAKGNQWIEMQGNYVLGWELPKQHKELKRMLRKKEWNSVQVDFQTVHVHHEETSHKEPLLVEDVSKPIMEIDNSNIYEIELSYANGEILYLSAYDWQWEKELLPLVRWLTL
ncbi:hypothetical protein WAF17_17815 [Bernardetia sp. ABR2-2B]|uniref:hypothetical protein n=1 Tax=Bernardetia sp. ABR2-2B TaxID=3127472 RepID=UPI0030D35F70